MRRPSMTVWPSLVDGSTYRPLTGRCSALRNADSTACNGIKSSDRQSTLDYKVILAAIPLLVQVLDEEGRNNSACKRARDSLATIIEKSGVPEALEGYLHNFKAPQSDSQWMKDYTAKYHQEALDWLTTSTDQNFGFDFDAWQDWFHENCDDDIETTAAPDG